MAIHIQTGKKNYLIVNNDSKVQSLPCRILADVDTKVTQYFEPSVTPQNDNTFTASFRGYPLKGQDVELPEGYVGVVLHESIAPMCEKQERTFHITNTFKSIRYWNWDQTPSKNDKIIQALDWIQIADALHSPIVEE